MFYLQQSVLNRIAFVLPSQMHKSVLRQAKRLLHNLTLYYHTLFQFLQLPKRRRWYHPLNHHTLLETESPRSEEHTSELQSRGQLLCRLLPEKKKPPCCWPFPYTGS